MPLSATRQDLLVKLKGQCLEIPDLSSVFKHWPLDISPSLEEMRALVPSRIDSMTDCPRDRKILEGIDAGLFTASWWPFARLERADILSCLALWLFIWDDETDAEVGPLAENFEAAQTFRETTIAYVKHCLKLSNSTEEVPSPLTKIVASFKAIGDAACEAYDLDHRKILFRELEAFVKGSEVEQIFRLSPELPTVEAYMDNRLKTSAVNIVLFFIEYAYDIQLPVDVLTDPDMRTIWDKTNFIVWTHNDLLSLKKEVAQQAIDSLVPLLYFKQGNMNLVVSQVIEMTEKAVRDFDLAEAALVKKVSHDDGMLADVKTYIDGCRRVCTGNLFWSLLAGRYEVSDIAVGGCVTTHL